MASRHRRRCSGFTLDTDSEDWKCCDAELVLTGFSATAPANAAGGAGVPEGTIVAALVAALVANEHDLCSFPKSRNRCRNYKQSRQSKVTHPLSA